VKPSRAFVGYLIGLASVCAAAIVVARLNLRGVTGSALTVRAVAHQWWWEFDYPSLGIKTKDVLYLLQRLLDGGESTAKRLSH